MERIRVDLPGREYEIRVGTSLTGEVARGVAALEGCRKAALVSHPPLARLHRAHWEELARRLDSSGVTLAPVLFRAGERYKNLSTVRRVYERLLALGLERSDALVAWGGGVVGDLAGFVAASYMRGIRFLQVPTTLMAMVDSSIGGKVGVDLSEGKNLVGFFHQPAGVYCDTGLLRTLPEREYLSGLAEAAKYALVFDAALCDGLKAGRDGLLKRRPEELIPAIATCAAIKARVTEEDERDLAGRRIFLNYGHTFAHALEAATSYRAFLHGEAVALGMRMAARLSERLGLAGRGLYAAHLDLLTQLGLAGTGRRELAAEGLEALMLERMAYDKKREGGKMRLVLLKDLGSPVVVEKGPDLEVAASIREVISEETETGRRGGRKA